MPYCKKSFDAIPYLILIDQFETKRQVDKNNKENHMQPTTSLRPALIAVVEALSGFAPQEEVRQQPTAAS